MTISRRDVTIGMGALGAFAATQALGAPHRKSAKVDVIVLGAGISGLQAALLLEQQGAKVMVLEGRPRVGGRVYTLMDQPGLPEMGFNSMAAGYGRGIDVAKKAGVELIDVGPRYMKGGRLEFVLNGKILTREQWAASPDNPFPADRKKMMPWEIVGATVAQHNPLKDWAAWQEPKNAALDISMHQFLSQQGLNDAAIKLAFDVSPYFGTTSNDVSALMYEFANRWTNTQVTAGTQSLAVKGGNQKLPEAMAKMIKGDVLLGKTIIAIESHKTGVKVTCADGASFEAKHAVCSLPFSTLRKIHFSPGLTGRQAKAVHSLPYQPISIAFLTVKSPFWETDKLAPSMWTNGPLGTIYAQYFGQDPNEVTGFTVQARGQLSKDWTAMGNDKALAMLVSQVETIRPAAKGQVTGVAIQSWTADPFSQGDWIYFSPGQIGSIVPGMAAPAGRVHFCGEHTAVTNRGMEGALESSERVAVELISA